MDSRERRRHELFEEQRAAALKLGHPIDKGLALYMASQGGDLAPLDDLDHQFDNEEEPVTNQQAKTCCQGTAALLFGSCTICSHRSWCSCAACFATCCGAAWYVACVCCVRVPCRLA